MFYAVRVELPATLPASGSEPVEHSGDSQPAIGPEAPLTLDTSELLGVDQSANLDDEFFDCPDQVVLSSKQTTV